MKKVLKKVLRSIFYIVVMSVLAFLPDFWLWHIGVSEWPLLLAILWWVPSLLLVLAEVGLQMGFFHKLSVRVLFSTILFSAFPKVVFILFDAFLPWFFALIPALGVMGWFAFGFIEGWKRLELKHITFTSPICHLILMVTVWYRLPTFISVRFLPAMISCRRWWMRPTMKNPI